MPRIGIIGAGAAGMMCAVTLLEANFKGEILLFDKNPVMGAKVAITGGGRCNVTTGIDDTHTLLTKYIRGSQFLKPALAGFPPLKVREWFNTHNVPLKEELDKRIFPVSNKGKDVVAVFEKLLDNPQIELHLAETVKEVTKKSAKFQVTTYEAPYDFDILVITTGGNTYQETGSNGDGYTFAKSLGHSITKLSPSLNSFNASADWTSNLAGLSLPDAKIQFEKQFVTGPMIFTHVGISGPAVFALAAHIAFQDLPFTVSIIPDARYNFDTCNAKLVEAIALKGSRTLVSLLMDFVPRRLAETIIELSGIPDIKGAELTKSERLHLARILTGELKLTLTAKTPGVEFVTAGGVSLDEVDRKTMQSKLVPNLYFAGEVLDIDAITGGFNLQSAWSTGRAAALGIINS